MDIGFGRLAMTACAAALIAASAAAGAAERIPIIDAHSQIGDAVAPERIIALMDAAGVTRTILAARRKTTVRSMVALARRHPDRITAAVRTKGGAYQNKPPRAFRDFLAKQMKFPEFAAMAEVLIFHAEKRDRKGRRVAPQVAFPPGHEKVAIALDAALKRGWPFVVHIEFASVGAGRAAYMAQLETMLGANPRHPFVLNHMGQLGPEEVTRLIRAHPNLYFIPAHSNPVTAARSREPWTEMFAGRRLSPPWRALVMRYPERFVLGFDNVWARHWENLYLPQVALWRDALADLPGDVAHAVAHGNAERLWRLPPAR